VAFFLFFLHGTSIGNGQQGISYNVWRLVAERDLEAQCFNLALCRLELQMMNVAHQPFLLQTAVMCWAVYQHEIKFNYNGY
jgi:hypothetical protein